MKKWLLTLLVLAGCASPAEDLLETSPSLETSPPLEASQRASTLGEFTLMEGTEYYLDQPGDRSGSIDIDTASQIASNYILEVLGEDLDGKILMLTFNYNPWITHFSWQGAVFESLEDANQHPNVNLEVIRLMINAETGERESLWDTRLELVNTTWEEYWSLSHEEQMDMFPTPDAQEIAQLKERASFYAQLHFEGREVVLIEHNPTEAGNPNASLLAFDNDGNRVYVDIQRQSLRLAGMNIPNE